MATTEERLSALATQVGTDVKLLITNMGDLTALSTVAKTTLVAAINELQGALGSLIDDTANDGATGATWSANKIFDELAALKTQIKDELVNGASAAMDTLQEISAALNDDPNFATTIVAGLNNRLRFDEAQTLTTAQRLQACTNIGIGNPDTDLVAIYTAAKNG